MLRAWPVAMGLFVAIGTVWSQPADPGYTPVAPPAALHAALQANLKQYGDWVNDKDFASAAATARGVIALAHLYGYQSSDPAWKKQVAELKAACDRLAAAAGQKNVAECQKGIDTCNRILADLAKGPPAGPRPAEKGFKPPAATKTWMLLMEGAYGDAKYAKTPQQLEHLVQALAEEVNAATYLRNDAGWRKQAFEVREAALQVAKHKDDLPAAKKLLKEVYNRCEACHQKYQK